IATSADVRRQVIEELLQRTRVRFFILEKVAFQSIPDFDAVMRLLKTKGAKAWVNCSYRRKFSIYQKIKQSIGPGERVVFNLSGGAWGLACNSIHFLDIFSYLTGTTDLRVDGSGLDAKVQPSKREGFIELTGTLKVSTSNNS